MPGREQGRQQEALLPGSRRFTASPGRRHRAHIEALVAQTRAAVSPLVAQRPRRVAARQTGCHPRIPPGMGESPPGADTTSRMPTQTFLPGPSADTVRTPAGQILPIPRGWELLMPGDAALTRRVKAAGEHWVVQEKVGRRIFSRGVWAPAATIGEIRKELAAGRSTEAYAKKRAAGVKRREKTQGEYVEDFREAVLVFLSFHARHAGLANSLATAVTNHATPVGSGTVARTQRIPIQRRAEAAVIAWMRHHTTGYDGMRIPRVRGKRREVRRMLAQRSKELLHGYRRGEPLGSACPLAQALASCETTAG